MKHDQGDDVVSRVDADSGGTVRDTSTRAVVEGFVVDDALRWQSMPEYLNFGLPATTRDSGDREELGVKKFPPRVSVTLSEYLAQDDSNEAQDDDPSDFGWFTPTASGASIEDLLPSADIRDHYSAPSPSYAVAPLLFDNLGSTTKTATLSPDSIARDSAGVELPNPPSAESHQTTVAPVGLFPVPNRSDGDTKSAEHRQEKSLHQQQRQVLSCAGEISRASDSSVGTTVAAGSRFVRPANVPGPLPVARRTSGKTNRIAEINQWHALHGQVSSVGALRAGTEGASGCIMHWKRTSFPISTRHFPEKPSTPRYRSGAGTGIPSQRRKFPSGSASAGGDEAARPRPTQRTNGAIGDALSSTTVEQQPRLRKVKPRAYAWALTEIRVVAGQSPWAPARAEYLVVACLGREKLVAGWRRASDFGKLARVARRAWMSKACVAWETLEHARRMDGGGPCKLPWVMRPRRLDAVYLQNKARFLEEFLKQFVFEANSKEALLAFLDPSQGATAEI